MPRKSKTNGNSTPAKPNPPAKAASAKNPANKGVGAKPTNQGGQSRGTANVSLPAALSVGSTIVGELAKHKKKKHKKGLLGGIGAFLDKALGKAISIAPSILHSLTNVHPDWSQGSFNRRAVLDRVKGLTTTGFPQGMTRNNAKGTLLVSKRVAKSCPHVIDHLRSLGQKVALMPNALMTAPAAIGAHMRYSFKTSNATHSKFGQGLNIQGCDYLDDVIGTAAERGDELMNLDLNPGRWDGTRVQKYAGMYERFIINNITMVYTPAVGTGTDGSIIGWFDYDPNDTSGAGRDAVVRAMGSIGQDNSPVWASQASHFRRDPEQPDYYVDADGSDDRLTSAGTWFLTVLSKLDAGVDGAFGSIAIVYDISFFVPSIQQIIPGPGPEFYVQKGGTSTVDQPLGADPAVDPESTMDLTVEAEESRIVGWSGTSTMPSRYFYIFHAAASTGLTGATITLNELTSVLQTPVVTATALLVVGVFDCKPEGNVDPADVWVQLATTGAAPTVSSFRAFRTVGGLTLKNKSLQDFERMALDTATKLGDFESQVSDLKKVISVLTQKMGSAPPAIASSSVPSSPSVARLTEPLNRCFYCGKADPDHKGKDCPAKAEQDRKTQLRRRIMDRMDSDASLKELENIVALTDWVE